MKIKSAMAMATLLISGSVSATPIPQAYVYGDEDDFQNRSCNALNKTASAAVEVALRHNGVQISSTIKPGGVDVWISVDALEFATGACAVAYSLQMYIAQPINGPAGRRIFGAGELCLRTGLMLGETSLLQHTLNENYRIRVEECLSEIEESLAYQ